VGVPGVEFRSGDDVGEPDGLLGTAQRGDRRIVEELEAAKEVCRLLAPGVEGCRGDRHRGDDHGLAASVVALDEGDDVRVAAGDFRDDARV
jgi:hypothetical protein